MWFLFYHSDTIFSSHIFISGGNYESNVIFSPKSYLPQSATFNVTVDLFGESVNIFEVSHLSLLVLSSERIKSDKLTFFFWFI